MNYDNKSKSSNSNVSRKNVKKMELNSEVIKINIANTDKAMDTKITEHVKYSFPPINSQKPKPSSIKDLSVSK